MTRTLAFVALATALLAAGAAGSVVAFDASPSITDGGQSAEIVPVANTTNYLSAAGEPDRTGYVESNVDVGTAAAIGAERLHGRHETMTFERAFRAGGSDERIGLVRDRLDRTAAELDRLDGRQATVFEAHANGSLSDDAFVRRLTRLEARATQSRELLGQIRSSANDAQTALPTALDTRLASMQARPIVVSRPVDEQVTDAVTGATDEAVVYASGTGDSLVLATVENGEFFRQATLRDEYAPERANQFEEADEQPITLAFQRAAELYPWVFENAIGNQRISGFGDSGIYLVDASHPHGELRSYIHGGTTNVFQEEHRLEPSAVPAQLTASNATEALELSVRAASETGPMRVTVQRPTTGVPVDTQVAIGGDPIGRTGSDGRLWTTRPDGSLRVNATTGDGERVVLAQP